MKITSQKKNTRRLNNWREDYAMQLPDSEHIRFAGHPAQLYFEFEQDGRKVRLQFDARETVMLRDRLNSIAIVERCA